MDRQPILFATGNQAKLDQLAYIIRFLHAPFEVVNARDVYGDEACYDETGTTAIAIAQHGARTLAKRLGTAVIVEDSTFHVQALDGAPGIKANTFLRSEGRAGILSALSGKPEDRSACIMSALAWAAPDGREQSWTQAVVGVIAPEERWYMGLPDWLAPTPDNPLGGGYNAIFIPRGSDRTLAEIALPGALYWGYRDANFFALLNFLTHS